MEENLRIVDAITDAFNDRDWDRLTELNEESVVTSGPDFSEPVKGRASLRRFFEALVAAYPDLRRKKVRTFGWDDWVCSEFLYSGTNTGPFQAPGGETVPPTNRRARVPICHIYRFKGAQVTEDRAYYDRLGVMAQLGLMP